MNENEVAHPPTGNGRRMFLWATTGLVLLGWVFPRIYAKATWEIDFGDPTVLYVERQWFGPTKYVPVRWMSKNNEPGWYARSDSGEWQLMGFYF